MAEELKHNVEEQKVHTMEVFVFIRNLGGFPNQSCKYGYMVH